MILKDGLTRIQFDIKICLCIYSLSIDFINPNHVNLLDLRQLLYDIKVQVRCYLRLSLPTNGNRYMRLL